MLLDHFSLKVKVHTKKCPGEAAPPYKNLQNGLRGGVGTLEAESKEGRTKKVAAASV